MVTALYRIIGIEFGALFLQTLVHRLDATLVQGKRDDDDDDEGKEAFNLCQLLCESYHFQLVGPTLLLDYSLSFVECMDQQLPLDLLSRVVKSRWLGGEMR